MCAVIQHLRDLAGLDLGWKAATEALLHSDGAFVPQRFTEEFLAHVCGWKENTLSGRVLKDVGVVSRMDLPWDSLH